MRLSAGHEHQVTAGDADVGAQGRALGADAFLDDLDEHFLAASEDVLDGRLDAGPGAGPRPRGGGGTSSSQLGVVVSSSSASRRRRGGRERLAGLDGPRRIVAALAEVLRLDVADVQEAVAADAEIDEGRLDAGLDVDDAALVDVADVVVLAGPFDVQLFQHAVLDDGDAAFFGLRTLISISCFMTRLSLSARQAEAAAGVAAESGSAGWRRRESWGQLHGCAAEEPRPRAPARAGPRPPARPGAGCRRSWRTTNRSAQGIVGQVQLLDKARRSTVPDRPRALVRAVVAERRSAIRGQPFPSRRREGHGMRAPADLDTPRHGLSARLPPRRSQPGRPVPFAPKRVAQLVHGLRACEVHLDQLVMAILSHRQRRRQIDPRARMAAFGHDQSHLRRRSRRSQQRSRSR